MTATVTVCVQTVAAEATAAAAALRGKYAEVAAELEAQLAHNQQLRAHLQRANARAQATRPRLGADARCGFGTGDGESAPSGAGLTPYSGELLTPPSRAWMNAPHSHSAVAEETHRTSACRGPQVAVDLMHGAAVELMAYKATLGGAHPQALD